jgi:hypothetical protein
VPEQCAVKQEQVILKEKQNVNNNNKKLSTIKFIKKGSPVHVAPACAGSGEESDHFGSYVHSFSLHFCKRLFLELEPMTSWSQGNGFTAVLGLPF